MKHLVQCTDPTNCTRTYINKAYVLISESDPQGKFTNSAMALAPNRFIGTR